MRRHHVPAERLFLESKLGQDAADDRRRCLAGSGARQLALGGERNPTQACAAVAGRFTHEQERRVLVGGEIGGKPPL
jgi:hypothetical protein